MMRPRFWWPRLASRLAWGASARPAARRSRVALDTTAAPPGTDLRWRPDFLSQPISPAEMIDPESGQGLGQDAALWHDGSAGGLRLSQLAGRAALAPYGLGFELAAFNGSYLSLSVDLPPEALANLLQAHILRLETALRLQAPLRVYARLNIRHGPNTDEILRDLPVLTPDPSGLQVVEFDLAVTDINVRRLEKIWLDLIFEHPATNVMALEEMILSRHLRASF